MTLDNVVELLLQYGLPRLPFLSPAEPEPTPGVRATLRHTYEVSPPSSVKIVFESTAVKAIGPELLQVRGWCRAQRRCPHAATAVLMHTPCLLMHVPPRACPSLACLSCHPSSSRQRTSGVPRSTSRSWMLACASRAATGDKLGMCVNRGRIRGRARKLRAATRCVVSCLHTQG